MPNHTLLETTSAPNKLSSPPAWSRATFGDLLVLLFAPLIALGYYAAVTFLKFLSREHSVNSPSC